MATILRQSTEIIVRIGPFVDATDGVAPEAGILASTADQAEALKANGAATVSIAAATWAAITGADGWYDLTLTTGTTDTIGELVIVIQDSSVALPVFQKFQVIEENVYDMFYTSGGDLGTTVDSVHSQTTVIESDSIIVESSVQVAESNSVVCESKAIQIYSDTTLVESNSIVIDSSVLVIENWGLSVTASDLAAIESELIVVHSDTLAIEVDTGNIFSDTTIIESDSIIVESSVQAIESTVAPIVSGTSDSGSTTTMVDAARTEADTDYWRGKIIKFTSGTAIGQCRLITGFNFTSNTTTFYPATTQAITTNTYEILPLAGIAALYSDTTIISSQTTVIESDSIIIESSVQVAESNSIVCESKAIQIYSDTLVIHSQTTVIESDAIVIKSDVALIETTRAEPAQGIPGATIDFMAKIDFLYKAWRNHSDQTSTLYQLYNDDTSTVDHKATVSDDATTFSREEIVSGP